MSTCAYPGPSQPVMHMYMSSYDKRDHVGLINLQHEQN